MLRAFLLPIILLAVSTLAPAIAGPTLSDDLETCRNKQAEDKAGRAQACERVIAGGQATGKDLALAYAVRGQAFMQKHAHDKAIAAFSAAHDADPDDPNFLYARGFAYEAKGDNDNAMADYNAVLEKRPKAFNAIYFRGTLYMRKNALQSALDDFNAALNIKPDLYRALADRGHLRTVTKDFDGALADFAEAERINPTGPMARNYRCQTYAAMGQFDKALADCNSVIEKEPKNLFAVTSRADTEQAKGDLTAALKDYNFVLGLNPNHVRAHAGRGQLFEKKHDLAQARADYRSAAFALTPYDNFDVGLARQIARERLAALTPQAPAPTDKLRKIALIIGNGAYKNVQELGNPPRDAKLVAAALKDVGFQTVTLSNDLARDKFFETLRAFATDAENADWAVVYYAGHGFEIGGVNYLVPIDAKLAADKDAETEAVALEQVIAAVGGARKLRLVMLDACRDNPFAPTMQHTMEMKLVDKGFSDIEPAAGFMVVYAAKHGETALDGDGVDSPFATAVARDIKEPHVEVRKLFDLVRDDVWSASKHQQQPFTYGSPPGREDFYFVAGK
ncbi:MAG TPA: caspase family protein [Bradyrhizobium sp.]|uniref:caspase family protein n=1 Tax=Bradyrhizobium sp. TaxID=376 RepID=UPI002C8C647F|nr:caspase family protein [Bradyrhizobium sp.]HTB04394.1 caspase family protein [Bradyrhizobium sp.]